MKILKRVLLGILVLIILAVLYVRIAVHESKPKDLQTDNADEVAQKILSAINKEAWDSLKYISWSFPGGHYYVWDRT